MAAILSINQKRCCSINKSRDVQIALARFKDAYDTEVQNWVDCAKRRSDQWTNCMDGYLAAVTADALVKAQETGQIEPIHTDENQKFIIIESQWEVKR